MSIINSKSSDIALLAIAVACGVLLICTAVFEVTHVQPYMDFWVVVVLMTIAGICGLAAIIIGMIGIKQIIAEAL